jgi:hypothetical protein
MLYLLIEYLGIFRFTKEKQSIDIPSYLSP